MAMFIEASHLKGTLRSRSGFHAAVRRTHLYGRSVIPAAIGVRRIAHLSAETGARFVRERICSDPVEWLLTPKRLFDGQSPVDACRTHCGFAAGMVLHEYSLGLDCAPASVAGLPRISEPPYDMVSGPPGGGGTGSVRSDDSVALYTFVISADLQPGHVQIYGAMVAHSAAEVRRRLRLRCGLVLEAEAIVRKGFDWSEPMACAMVSEAMANVLAIASAEPTSSIAVGLDFQVEQRFAN
jgi:hypothetical protein